MANNVCSVDTCIEFGNWLASTSLRFRPTSFEPFDKALSLTKCFEALSEPDKLRVQDALHPLIGPKLLTLSGFMAEAAINRHDRAFIRAAIVLHVIEDFRTDYRDNIRYLVLVAHAAEKLGVDFHKVTESVSEIASARARSLLSDFLLRADGSNRLASFGVKEAIVDDAFRFDPM